MKRIFLATVLLLMVTAQASAIKRYQTTSMTCQAIKAAIKNDGAAILRYQSERNPNLPLYGRYVKSRQYCQAEETTEFRSVPSKDTSSCPVLACVPIEFF